MPTKITLRDALDSPCHYCKERHPSCHSECEDYLKYSDKCAENRKKRLEQSRRNNDYYDMIEQNIRRSRKNKRR